MAERLWSFKWTWVVNYVSLMTIWLWASTAINVLTVDRDMDMWYGSRLQCYAGILHLLAQMGLYLYARRKGGMQAIEPPAEVFLFWFLLVVLLLAILAFGRPAIDAILQPPVSSQ